MNFIINVLTRLGTKLLISCARGPCSTDSASAPSALSNTLLISNRGQFNINLIQLHKVLNWISLEEICLHGLDV